MNILVCTIIRNQEHNLHNWYNQLKNIVNENSEITLNLSVYENNSTDKTKQLLNTYDFSFFSKYKIISEDLINQPFFKGGYEPYGEESKIRVRLLSDARNKCLDVDFITEAKYVLFVEPDIKYDTRIFRDILNFIKSHDYDIVSAISKSGVEHYDKWGTRLNSADTWTDLTNQIGNENILNVYATFNCFVLYRADAIVNKNCRFKYTSDILKSHDCDTVLICEEFRKNGFSKIGILTNKIVYHFF